MGDGSKRRTKRQEEKEIAREGEKETVDIGRRIARERETEKIREKERRELGVTRKGEKEKG